MCIKGVEERIPAYRLISTAVEREHVERDAPTFVGRTWEINTVTALLDEAVSGVGSVINVLDRQVWVRAGSLTCLLYTSPSPRDRS